MNRIKLAVSALILTICAPTARAFDFGSLFSGLGNVVNSDVVSNVIEGVFTTSNIDVKDLAGVWTASGSAVNFQSENLLNKAGGLAGAAVIENKLDSYYKKYGLTGAVFTIQTDGSFTLQVKKATLKGTITKQQDGNFCFKFQAFGKINIGSLTAYVTKSLNNMSIMFDASKLQSLLSAVASFTNIKLAQTASSLLNSYDGICVGFKLGKTGTVQGETTSSQSVIGGLLDGITGNNKNNTQTQTNTETNNNNTTTTNNNNTTTTNSNNNSTSPASFLQNLFKKK